MTKRITIAIKEPGKAWRITETEDSLPAYQKIVGGYIEHFYTNRQGIDFFCNEEGKLLGLEPNIPHCGDVICGTIFAARSDDEGEMVSLNTADITYFHGI